MHWCINITNLMEKVVLDKPNFFVVRGSYVSAALMKDGNSFPLCLCVVLSGNYSRTTSGTVLVFQSLKSKPLKCCPHSLCFALIFVVCVTIKFNC